MCNESRSVVSPSVWDYCWSFYGQAATKWRHVSQRIYRKPYSWRDFVTMWTCTFLERRGHMMSSHNPQPMTMNKICVTIEWMWCHSALDAFPVTIQTVSCLPGPRCSLFSYITLFSESSTVWQGQFQYSLSFPGCRSNRCSSGVLSKAYRHLVLLFLE